MEFFQEPPLTSSEIQKRIRSHIQESIRVKQAVEADLSSQIEAAALLFSKTLQAGNKILFCGNGGSAADAQHLATEFVVRLRSAFNRPAIAALALTVDTSTLTAAGNDFGFDHIFSRQVEALGKAGDLLVGISTSGNSANVVKAVEVAHEKNLGTIGFLGGNGGQLADLVGLALTVPSDSTMRIQESHIMIGHIICELTEEALFDGR